MRPRTAYFQVGQETYRVRITSYCTYGNSKCYKGSYVSYNNGWRGIGIFLPKERIPKPALQPNNAFLRRIKVNRPKVAIDIETKGMIVYSPPSGL